MNRYRAYTQRYCRYLPEEKSSLILDLGCGRGDLLSWLHSLGYFNIGGIDGSSQQVEAARENGRTFVKQGSIFEIPHKKKSVDRIFMLDVLEHLSRDQIFTVLPSIYSLLGAGGMLILQVPNASSPYFGTIRYGDITHEISFTETSIKQILRDAGFINIQVHSCRPARHGWKSSLRYGAWRILEFFLRMPAYIETGKAGSVTLNIIVTAEVKEP